MDDALRERVEALERAVTDGNHDLSALADDAAALDRLDAVENRVEDIESRVDELDAATQALRGYVGNVRSVNQDVEKRADAALAKAESLEAAIADSGTASTTCDSTDSHRQSGTADHDSQSATPDGGHSTASSGETTARHKRCHACGQPRASGERTRGADATDSLTAQSVLDGNAVNAGDGVGERDTVGDHDSLGNRDRGSDDSKELVPENDPLVSDDDTGRLRRLRKLL